MRKGVVKVNKWLLDQSPERVERLERDNINDMVFVGDSEKLKLNNVRLFVPEGIAVYRAIGKFKNMGEFFFAAREGSDMGRAYASWINTEKGGGLNYMHNVGTLLKYPWFNPEDSSRLFERLGSSYSKKNLYLVHLVQQTGPHPFSI